MQELITLIVQSLVKQPEAVSVTMEVIGKQGNIAKAIRAVAKAAAIKENKKIAVDIV